MASSSASIAAAIMKNLMASAESFTPASAQPSVAPSLTIVCDTHPVPAVPAVPAASPAAPASPTALLSRLCAAAVYAGSDEEEEDHYDDRLRDGRRAALRSHHDDREDEDREEADEDAEEEVEEFSHSGVTHNDARLSANFAQFGLNMENVINMMRDTSMVIGGGFMVNHILAMNGIDKPLCPNSDIDFYVYGGVTPLFDGTLTDKNAWSKFVSERIHATTFKSMVQRRFLELVSPVGYEYVPLDENYECERTESGDRVYTTGSKIRMNILAYKAKINGYDKKLNLIFMDTTVYDFITKVDITLTAGFFCASGYYQTFDYHHAVPKDVIEHRLNWMEPDSTHTPRQIERMSKYRTRYNLLQTLKMSTAEFVRNFDALPDEHVQIDLVGTEDEIHSKPVVRRVLGMPGVKFTIALTSPSILGPNTVYANFPTAADRAEYVRYKAYLAERDEEMHRRLASLMAAACPCTCD
jgi:hypothetical protein